MSKTSIFIELGGRPPVKVAWFGSPSTEELNNNICHVVGLAAGTPFQLLDSDGQPIIITPDLASDTTLQLVVAAEGAAEGASSTPKDYSQPAPAGNGNVGFMQVRLFSIWVAHRASAVAQIVGC